ncbi:MAG: 16S rRNA (adenine(1518)-N(6)/adenine(1519)-N(6))-dimethyltransferase RsmA [Balneolaceae bacterium]
MEHIRPKKSLGQHFLNDPSVTRRIAEAVPAEPGDTVLEVGPGTGVLTAELIHKYSRFRAVEIDRRAVSLLREKFPGIDLIQGDILELNADELLLGFERGERAHVVGNLPYYITSQILFALLSMRDRLKSAVVMMQKEVAERIVADHGSRTYGILSVQLQLMSRPEILFDVPPGAFIPPPAVTSSVVRLFFDRPSLNCSDDNLKRVVRTAFQQRRKKLSNALKPLGDLPNLPEFNFHDRPEAWPPRMYEKLTARLEQLGTLH